jgi:hypothetical protein
LNCVVPSDDASFERRIEIEDSLVTTLDIRKPAEGRMTTTTDDPVRMVDMFICIPVKSVHQTHTSYNLLGVIGERSDKVTVQHHRCVIRVLTAEARYGITDCVFVLGAMISIIEMVDAGQSGRVDITLENSLVCNHYIVFAKKEMVAIFV